MHIYIHIPFCDRKCSYCRFASIWRLQELQIQAYVQSLVDEIETSKYQTKQEIKTIYFGWWTPGVLNFLQLKQIFDALKKKYIFSKNIEITLETTPTNVSQESIIWWEKLWINRISMWVQTLNQQALNEIQRGNKWDIFVALQFLESSSIKNISIDFILWLPYVQKWEISQNIVEILSLYDFITHISVYMLEEYYEADKIIEHKYDEITYPENWKNMWLDDEDFQEEYRWTQEILEKMWFHKYEISNYARWNYECEHNKAYWNHGEMIAFWLWAYWYIDNTRYRNSENFAEYYAKKNIIFEKNSEEDIFIETIMFELRTTGISNKNRQKLDEEKIQYFIENNYLEEKNNTIILTFKWIPVMDYILGEIL